MTRPTRIALAVVLVVSLFAGAVPATAAAAGGQCQTEAVHDAYLVNNDTVTTAMNESVSSTSHNTQTTVTKENGFVRISGDNPNGYCVRFVVKLSDRIVPPSEVGEVDAVGESNATAQWRAMHDFETDETLTHVAFTLQPNSTATFAPSQFKVRSLAWAGKAKTSGGGLLSSVKEKYHNLTHDDLEQRHYYLSPENSSSIITVDLASQDGRQIDEWHALYRTDDDEDWRQVDKDSDKPVFYRKLDDGTVQFLFNDTDSEVEFVANPKKSDDFLYEYAAVKEGLSTILDSIRSPLGGSDE